MPISNLPVYTGTWPNASTQTDEDYANNTFFAHAWIGTTMTPVLNIIIPQFNSAIEDVIVYKDASATSANIAASAANNRGAWSLLSGALNTPAAVTHNGQSWILNKNLANVALSAPSAINTDWTSIGVSSADLAFKQDKITAKETTSSTSLSLTSVSETIQAVTMSVQFQTITLPNATTLSLGRTFIIKNTGMYPIVIANSGGFTLANLRANQIAIFYCTNISASTGNWVVGNKSMSTFLDGIVAGTILTVNAVASNYVSSIVLSATQVLVTYTGSLGYLQTCTLNISGTTITAGAILTVNAGSSNLVSSVFISATQVLVTYINSSETIQTCTLNISGTTITAGAILTVNAVASNYVSSIVLSATQALVTYRGTSGYLQTCTLNISGTTITAGAILTVNAVSSSYVSSVFISATQVLVTYRGTSSYLQSCTLNISGTTVTAGSVVNVSTEFGELVYFARLSSTQVLASYKNSSGLRACTLNISGTTITVGTILNITSPSINYLSLKMLSSTQCLIAYTTNNGSTGYLQTCTLNVSGTTVTVGTVLFVNNSDTTYVSIAALSATQVLVTYRNVGGNTNSCTLNISGTTITAGAIVAGGVASSNIVVVPLSTDKALLAYAGTSNYLQTCTLGVIQ